ncbi:sensor domain-containing diguanylate cyclase [Desulfobotulus sp. H1]|uniref:diguanylate cyclase n=1 Tax=Desulfobotulus pelophilus TaxID=2823377 RepID=A0ABT3N678_9BACT|nr:sensor domain-containing diguanylate cyclase [Desulfobotulus pelophilus]MCW7752537.1 sensor domain-containing diguanylate cyclase [Desulfobotulus pelophilus]
MAPITEETVQELESKALLACLEVGKRLTSTLDLNEILQLIMEKICTFVMADHWSLLLRDEETGELHFTIVVGVENDKLLGVRIERGKGIAGHAAETCRTLFVENAQEDPHFFPGIDQTTGFETKSVFCLPLCIHGKVLGVIEIINLEDIRTFETRHLPILTLLADYAAIAIRNAQFLDKIRLLSITDEYTGLYNARYMHQILETLILKAESCGTKLAVAFMDMDHFKSVVDSRGHLMGSRVLREVGQTLKENLGHGDIVAKYGGDEYVMIFSDCGREQAQEKCSSVLTAVRNTLYLAAFTNQPGIRVTASIGFAIYPDDARTKKDLLLLADRAMYRVKRGRKNAASSWNQEDGKEPSFREV